MIGNELNSTCELTSTNNNYDLAVYGEDLSYLFSLAKDMVALRDFMNISHPITMPLAADSSLENILTSYHGVNAYTVSL